MRTLRFFASIPALVFCAALPLVPPPLLALPPGAPAAALRAPIAAEFLGSARYYLNRYDAAPELGAELGRRQKDILAALFPPSAPEDMKLDALLAAVGAAAAKAAGPGAAGKRALRAALDETAYYFSVSGAGIMEPVPAPSGPAAGAAGPARGFSPEVPDLSSATLPMRDLAGYIRGQAGPMAYALDALSRGGFSVLFSRRPFPEAARLLSPAAEFYRLNIPGSTYGFEAYLAYGGARPPQLLLCAFSGDYWFFHVQTLYRLYFSREGLNPEVFTDPAAAPALPCPGIMEAFSSGGAPRAFAGLLLGYSRELKEAFGPRVKREFSGAGFRAFEAEIAGRSYVAVETRDPWYGDILGTTVRALLDSGVRFGSVYFAGSAGSLQYATPYAAGHPDCFLDEAGRRLELRNALSGGGPGLCHQTVKSPLEETKAYLAALPPEAGTIDVEGLPLVKAVLDYNAVHASTVTLGVSYLVTDYPRGLPITENYSLSNRNYGGKLAGARNYADFLLRHLSSGTLAYAHPFENELQEGTWTLSARNMAALLGRAEPFTPEESGALKKIAASEPPFIMRMRPNRLERILESGLALAPREVGIMNGLGVSTYTATPSFEDELYGAWDYLYAGIGQNNRARMYGDVQVFISSGAWLERSYATRYSGMRLAAGGLDKARTQWADIIVAPEDYSRYLGLAYINYARAAAGGAELRKMEAAGGPAEIYAALADCEDCYLEGKILKYFTLDEIACVELPADAAVPGAAAALKGRVFSNPGACLRALGR